MQPSRTPLGIPSPPSPHTQVSGHQAGPNTLPPFPTTLFPAGRNAAPNPDASKHTHAAPTFMAGSSKHGNALRAPSDSNWVEPSTRVTLDASAARSTQQAQHAKHHPAVCLSPLFLPPTVWYVCHRTQQHMQCVVLGTAKFRLARRTALQASVRHVTPSQPHLQNPAGTPSRRYQISKPAGFIPASPQYTHNTHTPMYWLR